MRELGRGALLSVLFFALLIGGAPGMALAHQGADGCTVAGCTSDHKYTDGSKHQDVCDSMDNIQSVGVGMATVGGVALVTGFGSVLLTAGGIAAGIGYLGGKLAGC